MGTLTKAYDLVDGTIAEASSVNRIDDDAYATINGNINSANIATSGVDTVNINGSAVTAAKIADASVGGSKIDAEVFIAAQVWNG